MVLNTDPWILKKRQNPASWWTQLHGGESQDIRQRHKGLGKALALTHFLSPREYQTGGSSRTCMKEPRGSGQHPSTPVLAPLLTSWIEGARQGFCPVSALFWDDTTALPTEDVSFRSHWTSIFKHPLCTKTSWQPCGRYKSKPHTEPALQS